ncbi:MAG TPA: hypothetical protein VF704_04485 [Allosphingosinicella sp.]|jgi:Flp pilus assembly pilin Flp
MLRALALLKKLRGDERGLSVIELGLIAPVLALFISGIIDLSSGLAQRFAMQKAVNETLELLLAYPLENDTSVEDADVRTAYAYLINHVAEGAGIAPDEVEIERWLQCDDAVQDDYASICEPGEDQARYISLEIEKDFNGQFFVGEMTMTAFGVMRIE